MSTSDTPLPTSYRGYKGLPPLVGLLNMDDAIQVGLTVEQSVNRLKRHHWAMRRMHEIFLNKLTSMPVYELKMAFSLHGHYMAEHVAVIRTRVREMRQPPYGLDISPSEPLDIFFDELRSAPNTEALVLGLYEKAVPALVKGLEKHIADTNRLFDHPTYRACRLALIEMKDIAAYGREAVSCLVDQETRDSLKGWLDKLDRCLSAAGGMDGTSDPIGEVPEREFSGRPFVYDGKPQRDKRFVDPYNMGVNAEAMLFDESYPAQAKVLMMYFKRLREIDVPEMMASILAETEGKPWDYTRDMTRQLWDEARHAMMGEIGFVSLGIDWTRIPINFTWSLGLNSELTPKERHSVLFTIEQGLMPKATGKEAEWEIAIASDNPLSQRIQDYDWADEILHARIGRDWIVPEIGSQAEAVEFGSECWSRVLKDWSSWKELGLTEHRNWWPEVYQQACKHWGVEPDPHTLAYHTNYSDVRADLKEV